MNKSILPYRLWLNQALDDLSWTKSNLKEQIWYGACFTAQQASEKALKATLTDYYAPARYPDIGEFMEFNEESAKQAYSFAEKIVSFIEKKLSS